MEKQQRSVYAVLAEHQTSEAVARPQLYELLHRLADRFIVEYRLGIEEYVVGIGRLRRRRLGQFRYGTNDLGLRAEIILSDRHVADSVNAGEAWRIYGTLLHELLHAWQETHGRPGRRNYHNRQFRRKAAELGLIVDERGCTEYDPGSPFFNVLGREGIEYTPLPTPKLFRRGDKDGKPSSKLALWACACDPPQRARIGRSDFDAVCSRCNSCFRRI